MRGVILLLLILSSKQVYSEDLTAEECRIAVKEIREIYKRGIYYSELNSEVRVNPRVLSFRLKAYWERTRDLHQRDVLCTSDTIAELQRRAEKDLGHDLAIGELPEMVDLEKIQKQLLEELAAKGIEKGVDGVWKQNGKAIVGKNYSKPPTFRDVLKRLQ